MQGDVKSRLNAILTELEEINREFKSKALEKAMEFLKIAISEEIELKGSESFNHYIAKKRLIEMLGGSIYLESESTKISKIGYRPDAVIIRGDEVIILEIETDKKKALKKFEKIKKNYNKILSNPIFTNRKARIIFGVFDVDEKLIKKAESVGIELYKIGENIEKIR